MPSLEARLGKLVQFTKREHEPRRRPADAAGATGAEVVLFTGVRYERATAPVPDKPMGPASGTRRRRV